MQQNQMSSTSLDSSSQAVSVQLTETDIPGAALKEPMEQHTIPELAWWLLCRGIRAPASWKKQQLVARSVLSAIKLAN